jgi:4-amino-4-deoxy-L-arabinose transferase-like glycosyltransferase
MSFKYRKYNYFPELSQATRGLASIHRELALIVIVLVCFLLIINSSWKASPDSALYLELGESLAHGSGYKFNGEQHTYVPPGYPFFIAVTVKLFGPSFFAYRVIMSLLGILTAYLGYILIYRLAGRDLAFLIGGLFAINNTLLLNSTFTTSDTLFTLLGLVGLILVSSNNGSARPIHFIAAAALTGAPALVRINGWGLPISTGLFLLSSWEKQSLTRRITLTLLFVIVAFAVPCVWEIHKMGYPDSYNEGQYIQAVTGRTLGTQVSIIVSAAWDYIPETSTALAGVSIKTGLIEIFIVCLVLIGFCVSWKRGERLFTYLTVVQFGGLLLSPAGSRYILLLIPGLLLFLFQGVVVTLNWLENGILDKWREKLGARRVVLGVFLILFVTNLGQDVVTISEARFATEPGGAESVRDKPFFVAARWLKEYAAGQPVLTMNPRIIRYLTGLPTVELLRSGAPEEAAWPETRDQIARLIDQKKPGFLFLDNKDPRLKKLILEAADSNNLDVDPISEASFGNRYNVTRLRPRR